MTEQTQAINGTLRRLRPATPLKLQSAFARSSGGAAQLAIHHTLARLLRNHY
jgi:hypothetical protein